MFQLIISSIYVFLGACSFGILSTIVKLAYQDGFSFREVAAGQYGFGWCILLAIMLLFSRQRVSIKQFLCLAIVGASTCLTGIFYYFSLQTTPASIAIILLFQFVWMNILFEGIVTKKRPSNSTIFSILLLITGTVLAGGIVTEGIDQLDLLGTVFGLCAAVMMSLFIFLSGKMETELPLITRSFYISTGGLLVILTFISPKILLHSLIDDFWLYGLILAIFGTVIPIFLFSLGAPKIRPEFAAILSAGELPVAIIASAVVLHEQINWIQWLGVLIVLGGIIYPQVKSYQVNKQTLLCKDFVKNTTSIKNG